MKRTLIVSLVLICSASSITAQPFSKEGILATTDSSEVLVIPEANLAHPLYSNTAIYDSKGPLGRYLIATNMIPAATLVAKFEGPISTDCFHRHSKWVRTNENGESECMRVESSAVYVNHSCDPNCKVDTNDWSIWTIKDIKQGEALTISYNNPDYFPIGLAWDPAWNFDCYCESSSCPKKITQWLKN